MYTHPEQGGEEDPSQHAQTPAANSRPTCQGGGEKDKKLPRIPPLCYFCQVAVILWVDKWGTKARSLCWTNAAGTSWWAVLLEMGRWGSKKEVGEQPAKQNRSCGEMERHREQWGRSPMSKGLMAGQSKKSLRERGEYVMGDKWGKDEQAAGKDSSNEWTRKWDSLSLWVDLWGPGAHAEGFCWFQQSWGSVSEGGERIGSLPQSILQILVCSDNCKVGYDYV